LQLVLISLQVLLRFLGGRLCSAWSRKALILRGGWLLSMEELLNEVGVDVLEVDLLLLE
jgi:hypothetical protein